MVMAIAAASAARAGAVALRRDRCQMERPRHLAVSLGKKQPVGARLVGVGVRVRVGWRELLRHGGCLFV